MVTLQLLQKPSLHSLFSISSPQQTLPPSLSLNIPRNSAASPPKNTTSRRQLIAEAAAISLISGLSVSQQPQKAFADEDNSLSEWEEFTYLLILVSFFWTFLSSLMIPLTSPRGSSTGNTSKEERPRFFDSKAKGLCWDKAETVAGRHPERWRKDAAGNIIFKRFHSCQGCLCFEFDHIIPFSKGGQSVLENCQILQTRVNRFKSDKEDLKKNQLKGYSCDINFSDNELDIIEMAVYGDVIRPGKECRCRSINEMLGRYKSKDQIAACK